MRKPPLYVKDRIHGKIPNWPHVIRCQCCMNIFRAKPLTPKLVDEAGTFDDEHVKNQTTMIVPYAECPKCYGWHAAEFSLS